MPKFKIRDIVYYVGDKHLIANNEDLIDNNRLGIIIDFDSCGDLLIKWNRIDYADGSYSELPPA